MAFISLMTIDHIILSVNGTLTFWAIR